MNDNAKKIINSIKSLITNSKIFYVTTTLFMLIIVIFNNYCLFNGTIIVIFIYWIYSVLYCTLNIERYFLTLMMLFCYFSFIISRPLISFFRGDEWWYFSNMSVSKALLAIYLSLVFIILGCHFCQELTQKKEIKNIGKKKSVSKKSNDIIENNFFHYKILRFMFIMVFVAFCFNFYVEIYNYISLHKIDYASVYTGIVPTHCVIVRLASSLFLYFAIFYLCTMPKKKHVYIIFLLLFVTSIPSFLLGSRNTMVLRLIFMLVYIFIRNNLQLYNEIWITKRVKKTILIMIPIVIILMGAYNYIRDNKSVESSSIISLIVDTFYKQGTTFDTICQGFEYEKKLQEAKKISYTLGDIIDYILHNTLSQKVFSTKPFPNGNSLVVVKEGNSLAHKLSYYVLGEYSYLGGHGRGTSYIIETYLDASYLGLCIYSFALGYYLSVITMIIKKSKILLSYIVLMSLYEIYLLPRFSASGFISFIVKPYFWIAFFGYYFVNYVYKYLNKKRKA